MSTLNQYLLKHCLDNGASSSDLNSAQVQALLAQGATGSTLADLWMSYLSAQGQTSGTHADRLGALLTSKGYVGTLNDKLLAACKDGALFGFSYASLFAKYSGTGWCRHGGKNKSKYFSDSAGTVPCISSGDPVGYVKCVAGTDLYQETSPAMPVFYTDGTHNWLRKGAVSGVARWMHCTSPYYLPLNPISGQPEITYITVGRMPAIYAATGGGTQFNLTTFGYPGPGGYSSGTPSSNSGYGDSYGVRPFMGGFGATGELTVDYTNVYLLIEQYYPGIPGSSLFTGGILSAQSTTSLVMSNGSSILLTGPGPLPLELKSGMGLVNANYGLDEGFEMVINSKLSSADLLKIITDLKGAFAGWAP